MPPALAFAALLLLLAPIFATNIDNCQALSTANGAYTLTANPAQNSSTCFNISAANITLDCAGYTITGTSTSLQAESWRVANNSNYSDSTNWLAAYGFAPNITAGIFSNATNTTVKNCIINGMQYGVRLSPSYSLGSMSNSSSTLPGAFGDSQPAIVGDYVYLFGGTSGSASSSIYRAPLSSPTSWSDTGSTLPAPTYRANGLIITGDSIYMFGGANASAITTLISSAPVSNPTSWSGVGNLPTALELGQMATINGYIYIFGGFGTGNSVKANIYRANTSNPTVWADTGSSLPAGRYGGSVAVIGDYIYYFGGFNSGFGQTATIYRALLSSPTSWSDTGSSMPVTAAYSHVAIIGDSIYLFGGSGTIGNHIYYANLTTPTTWADSGASIFGTDTSTTPAAVIGGNLYLFGTYDGSNYKSSIFLAPIYASNNSNSNITNNTISLTGVNVSAGLWTRQANGTFTNNTVTANRSAFTSDYSTGNSAYYNNLTAPRWVDEWGNLSNNYNTTSSGNIYYFANGTGIWQALNGSRLKVDPAPGWSSVAYGVNVTNFATFWSGNGADYWAWTGNSAHNAFINITNVTISSSSGPKVGGWIALTMTATTNSSGTLTAYVSIFKNGANQTGSANSTTISNNTAQMVFNLTSGLTKGDIWNYTVYVGDGTNTSGANITQGVTIQNTAPTNASALSFTDAASSHQFNVSGSADDADGASDINYTNITTDKGSCVSLSNSTSGNTFTVTYNCSATFQATPGIQINFQDKSASSVSSSNTTHAYPDPNNATLSAPSVNDSAPLLNSTLNCNVGTFSDSDSDVENTSARTWIWYKNGASVGGATSQTLTLNATNFSVNDNLSCRQTTAAQNWTTSNPTALSSNVTIGAYPCASLATAGQTYTLNGNLNSAGTCFNITAANATLNCAGYSISGTNSSSTYGAYSSALNSTIKNCIISNFSGGIYLTGSNSSNATNNTLSSTFSPGMAGSSWTQQTASGSGGWYAIASSADGTRLAAAPSGSGSIYIYTSKDAGLTWTQQTGSGQHQFLSIASSSDGTKLAASDYNSGSGGYIYTSSDSGATWTRQTGSDTRKWGAITSSSDGTHLAAVPNGGWTDYIYTSSDSGVTWTARDAGRTWQGIASSADGTKLVAVVSNGYIYTSSDSGATWTARTGPGIQYWQAVASSSDGTKLAAGISTGYIYTSSDSGATWTAQTGSGSRAWQSIASSADGTRLAAVANTGVVYTSTDSGVTWTANSISANQLQGIAMSTDGSLLAAADRGSSNNGYMWTAFNVSRAVEVLSSSGVSVTNNVINFTSTALVSGASTSSTTFSGNNISAAYWVIDNNGTNYYNTSSFGNSYYLSNGTASWSVFKIYTNGSGTWAVVGTDRPFNATSVGGNWSGSGNDWYPYTANSNPAPTIFSAIAFTNASSGHWFYANATAADDAGGSDINSWNASSTSGSCANYSNSTGTSNKSVVFNCSSSAPSTPTVNITFIDSQSQKVSTSSSNTYPDPNNATLTSPSVNDSSPTVTSLLNCNVGTFADSDADVENTSARTWLWYKNGTSISGATSQPLQLNSTNFSKADKISCRQTTAAQNWTTSNPTAISSNITIADSAPTISSAIAFINASSGHWFYANATASDNDGGTDINSWNASSTSGSCANYSNSTSGLTRTVVFNCSSSAPSTPTVNITFIDSSSSTVSTSSTNTYSDPNNATLTSPSVNDSSPTVTSLLNCNVGTFADSDADVENTSARTWLWYKNGTSISGATSQTLQLNSTNFSKADTISCRQTTAAQNWTTSNPTALSSNVTIGNSAPTIFSAIAFTNASSGHWFYANATAADNDGGSDIISWNVSATSGSCANYSNSTGTSNKSVVFNCSASSPSATTVNITFIDSASATVSTSGSNAYPNQLPNVTNATISPSTVYKTTAELNCTNGTASDADGDAVSFYYLWYKNGSATGLTTFNITNASFNKSDVLICQITPYDGYQNGSAVNSTAVTVSNSLPSIQNLTILNLTQNVRTACQANVTDGDGQQDLTWINFTVTNPSGGTAVSNTNGTAVNATFFNSSSFNLSTWGEWNCSATAVDSSNASVTLNGSFTVIREWQKYYGGTLGQIALGSGVSSFLINWSATHGQVVYVAEPTVNVNFTYLYALGVCPNGSVHNGSGINDFSSADSALGLSSSSARTISGFFDSNADGIADSNQSFMVFGRNVTNVPSARISSSSPFATGIFWQGSSGSNVCYNGVQDLVFAVSINRSAAGLYGTSDYELMIPEELAKYKNSSNRLVAFYGEYRGQSS